MTEFISRKYGNNGYEVIIKTDSHEHYTASEEFARRLIGHAKPMTNADWIRSMTGKELAEFIGHNSMCDRVQGESGNWCNDHNCTDCLEEWLQQPAEEKE